jgi:hypothetical protein
LDDCMSGDGLTGRLFWVSEFGSSAYPEKKALSVISPRCPFAVSRPQQDGDIGSRERETNLVCTAVAVRGDKRGELRVKTR